MNEKYIRREVSTSFGEAESTQHCATGLEEQREATATKAKQTGCPRGAEGLRHHILGVGAGQDGAWGKARGFLFNICFSPSPVHAHSPPSWKNPDPFECGGVAM